MTEHHDKENGVHFGQEFLPTANLIGARAHAHTHSNKEQKTNLVIVFHWWPHERISIFIRHVNRMRRKVGESPKGIPSLIKWNNICFIWRNFWINRGYFVHRWYNRWKIRNGLDISTQEHVPIDLQICKKNLFNMSQFWTNAKWHRCATTVHILYLLVQYSSVWREQQ